MGRLGSAISVTVNLRFQPCWLIAEMEAIGMPGRINISDVQNQPRIPSKFDPFRVRSQRASRSIPVRAWRDAAQFQKEPRA
jgi:hypothetical protein